MGVDLDMGFLGEERGAGYPLFPRARMTLVLGDPGVGKSLLGVHLAARHAARSPMPPEGFAGRAVPEGDEPLAEEENPGLALLFSREDDADTVGFRLEVAAEGKPVDGRFVQVMEYASLVPERLTRESLREGRRSPMLTELEALARRRKIGLVVIDPLPAYLEGHDAANNAALIRAALNPLLDFAHRHDVRVVGIGHLAKERRCRSLVHQMAHSQAYTALARSVVLMTEDPGGDRRRRMMVPVKNAFALAEGAFGLRIERSPCALVGGREVAWLRFEGEAVAWEGGSCWDAKKEETGRLELEEAAAFLQVVLEKGPVASLRVMAEARSVGIGLRTLRRAKAVAGVRTFRKEERWWLEVR